MPALRSFEAAARHQSIKQAAQELHVTPSAVSHAVAGLEAHLGIKLFHRQVRRLVLTDAGRSYLAAVSSAFEAISAASQAVSARSRADLVTLASTPTFARVWLIPQLKDFMAVEPDIDVKVIATTDSEQRLQEDCDLAIAYGRGPWPGYLAERLVQEQVVPLCSLTYLKKAPPLTCPADLKHHCLLHTDTKLVSWEMWLEAAGVKEVDAQRGPRFNRAYLALDAAVASVGVALDTHLFAESLLADGSLVVPFDAVIEPSMLGGYDLLCRPQSLKHPKVQAFRDWILAAAAEPSGLFRDQA